MDLKTDDLNTQDDFQDFLSSSRKIGIKPVRREDTYALIEGVLRRTGYLTLRKGQKGSTLRYLEKVTGLSRAQVQNLIRQFRDTRHIRDGRQKAPKNAFMRIYTAEDRALVAKADRNDRLSGPAMRWMFKRQYHDHGDERYRRLAYISNGQFYKLRNSVNPRRQHGTDMNRRSRSVAIGERRQPKPEGKPGYLRIDTVHQGDSDGKKGVYHINAVDEATQMMVAYAVPTISERHMAPALKYILDAFPFVIRGFHSDNGSEFVNRMVADMLERLFIEFTKSRPRRSNDNGLVESKNGSIIRKWFGYQYIDPRHAGAINRFYIFHLMPYYNYHRPCWFPVEWIDEKGRRRRRYSDRDMTTPYEKLKSLPQAASHLKPGLTFEKLDEIANRENDLNAAEVCEQARKRLFRSIQTPPQTAT